MSTKTSASWRQCDYVHPTGRECGSPAMRDTSFCYHHRRRQLKPAAAYIPDLTNPKNISVALGEIMRAMLTNRISSEEGGRLVHAIQMAMVANKRAAPLRSNMKEREPGVTKGVPKR
jgi:hypothetical protein